MKIKNLYRFFNCLGLFAFAFIIIDSATYLLSGDSDWRIIVRLLIGIGGFLVDSFLIFIYKKEVV